MRQWAESGGKLVIEYVDGASLSTAVVNQLSWQSEAMKDGLNQMFAIKDNESIEAVEVTAHGILVRIKRR